MQHEPLSFIDALEGSSKCNPQQKEQQAIAAMQRIQQIAGNKPADWVTTMADWQDESSAELELRALIKHFKLSQPAQHYMLPSHWGDEQPTMQMAGIIVMHDRHGNAFPFINDPKYFEPKGLKVKRRSMQLELAKQCKLVEQLYGKLSAEQEERLVQAWTAL